MNESVSEPGTVLYYDSALGRFLSIDPVTPSPGETFSFNAYSYADNNPIKNIDTDGRCTGSNVQDKAGNCADSDMSVTTFSSASGGVHLTESRVLTKNEAQAGKEEFKDLNTDKARVAYDSPHKESAVTANNTMHFPKSSSDCQDFVTCREGVLVGWFIHELTHVWQYQNGIDPVAGHFRAGIFKNSDYLPFKRYLQTPDPSRLNTEEQGDWHMWHYACEHHQWDGC